MSTILILALKVATEFVRAATRPIISIIFAAVIAQVVVEGIEVPPAIWALLSVTILWWFGDRTVSHIKKK